MSPSDPWSYTAWNNATVFTLSESFTDFVGQATVKDCDHWRVWASPVEVFHVFHRDDPYYHEEWDSPDGNYFSMYTAAQHGNLAPLPSEVEFARLSDLAYEAFYTQVPQEVSLGNFLLELRELGGLIPSLQSNMAKTVSGGYLSYQFGWKPFLADLKALRSLNQTVLDRIQWLKDRYGQKSRLGVVTEVNEALQDIPQFIDPATRLRYTKQEGIFRCGGYLTHYLENLDGLEGQLRAFSAALGLNNPAAVLWESIPFSFVSDWFTRSGALIRRSAVAPPFSGAWNITDVTWSCRRTWEANVERNFNSTFNGTDSPKAGRVEWRLSGERYVRGTGIPGSWSILQDTTPDSRQQTLLLALMGANTR